MWWYAGDNGEAACQNTTYCQTATKPDHAMRTASILFSFCCCWRLQFDSDIIPSGKPDVGVTKTVSPAVPNNAHVSQTKTVGFVFEFTITVTLNGNDPAQDVVMTDNLPDGLELESVTEPEGACSYTVKTIK